MGKKGLFTMVAMVDLMFLEAALAAGKPLYPNIAVTRHGSLQAVKFFQDYFTAKSSDNSTLEMAAEIGQRDLVLLLTTSNHMTSA